MTLATALLALAILRRHSFSQSTSAYSALGALETMRYTNRRFTYLLTYREDSALDFAFVVKMNGGGAGIATTFSLSCA